MMRELLNFYFLGKWQEKFVYFTLMKNQQAKLSRMQKFLPIISIIIPTILIHNIWQTGAYLIYNLSIALGIIIITHGLLIFLLYRVFRFFKAQEI